MNAKTRYRLEVISCTTSWITVGALSNLLLARGKRGWTDDAWMLVVLFALFAVNALTQSRDLLRHLRSGATRRDGASPDAPGTAHRGAVPFTILTHSVGCLAFGSMSALLLNEWPQGWGGDGSLLGGFVLFLGLGAFSDTRKLWKHEPLVI